MEGKAGILNRLSQLEQIAGRLEGVALALSEGIADTGKTAFYIADLSGQLSTVRAELQALLDPLPNETPSPTRPA